MVLLYTLKIEGKPQLTATDNETVTIKVAGLDTANAGLSFKSDDTTVGIVNNIIDELRLGYTETNGISISE